MLQPVGFEGELIATTLVLGPTIAKSCSRSSPKPTSGSLFISTGTALPPAIRVASTRFGQMGDG